MSRPSILDYPITRLMDWLSRSTRCSVIVPESGHWILILRPPFSLRSSAHGLLVNHRCRTGSWHCHSGMPITWTIQGLCRRLSEKSWHTTLSSLGVFRKKIKNRTINYLQLLANTHGLCFLSAICRFYPRGFHVYFHTWRLLCQDLGMTALGGGHWQ